MVGLLAGSCLLVHFKEGGVETDWGHGLELLFGDLTFFLGTVVASASKEYSRIF